MTGMEAPYDVGPMIRRAQEAAIAYVLCSCASFHVLPRALHEMRYMKWRRAACPYIGLIDMYTGLIDMCIGLIDMCHVVGAT